MTKDKQKNVSKIIQKLNIYFVNKKVKGKKCWQCKCMRLFHTTECNKEVKAMRDRGEER